MHRLIDIQWCTFWGFFFGWKIINLLEILRLFNDSNWLQPMNEMGWKEKKTAQRWIITAHSKEKLLMIDSVLECISKIVIFFASLFFRLMDGSVIKTIIYLQIFNYLRLLRKLKNNFSSIEIEKRRNAKIK